MSTSRPISSTRIAQILTTVLSVLCCLPLAVRSARYSLTSNAYQTGYQDTSSFRLIDSQWEYYDTETLYKGIPLVGDGEGTYTCYQVGFVGEYRGSKALQYAFDIYDSSGNTRLYSSVYYDSGQLVNVGLPLVQSTDNIVYRCELYVKLKDGGNIERTDMYAGAWTWYLNRTTEVEEQTLPAEWFETTTATLPELTTYTTVATTVPYEGVLTTLTIPSDIRPAIAQFEQIVYDLWALHYMPFIIIFGILVALAAWLLH